MPFDASPRKVNEVSVGLRKMAEIFRREGFAPSLSFDFRSGACCFIGTAAKHLSPGATPSAITILIDPLRDPAGGCLSDAALIRNGWTADPTGEKAAQLCERVAAELELA